MTNELPGIYKRWIVTAYNNDGQAYRYMATNDPDARQTEWVYTDMGLHSVTVRCVLWDNRKNAID